MEVRMFRLVLFLSTLAFIGGIGGGVYLTHRSAVMHADVSTFYKDLTASRIACEARPSSGDCQTAELSHQGFKLAVELRNKYDDSAGVAFSLGLLVPGGLLLLFYGLRWCISGRLRPLWVPIGHR